MVLSLVPLIYNVPLIYYVLYYTHYYCMRKQFFFQLMTPAVYASQVSGFQWQNMNTHTDHNHMVTHAPIHLCTT